MSEVKADLTSILETAQTAGTFSTLLTAVEAAGLTDALSGEGPFTIFAPTDAAFAALPEGTVQALLKDKEKLSSILTYHVLSGAVKAESIVELDKAETLNGQSVSIKVVEKKVMIDNALVTTTDIICTNGVIHVIDSVILPKS
ncbi:MAG: fasciclin domain-containing protein [Candidatus Zixiibacteriota bacterium]|nr:MAG: fasciclin domain-containing protein [candidate division Zixibacteria bacterium]